MDPSELPYPKVLVTGAAGWIGLAVCPELVRRGHQVRGFDRLPAPDLEDMVIGDLSDADAVKDAVEGVDAIVHLGATADDADFLTDLLPNNYVGSYNIFEAAREAGVERVVAASSMQAIMGFPWTRQMTRVEDGTSPINHYGVSKVFLESMAGMYVRTAGMSVIVGRIGWCPRGEEQRQVMLASVTARASYLSPRDAGRFFACAVEARDVEYAVLFATSRPPGPVALDIRPAREIIGYEPIHCFPEGFVHLEGCEAPEAPPAGPSKLVNLDFFDDLEL